MKLQLKRSNVIESGAAKIPTSAQLEYGELAINYNQEDPAIFLKDSNNNVIRISGIGNIADDGQVELPASTTPPANPLSGNLWFNSDDGRLYIYYTDADSSQWVDASPDSWDPSSYPDLTDPTKQPNTLDDRYVMDDGDNMTGDLTLGTDKITLNASDGSINAAGWINTELEIKTTRFGTSAGLAAAADAAFRVGTNADTKAKIGYDGSITAAGNLRINNASGDAQAYLQNDGSLNVAWGQLSNGLSTYVSGPTGRHYIGFNGNANTGMIVLNPSDGSGTFAGNILANGGVGVNGGASLSTGLYYRDDSESYGVALYSGGSAESNRKVFITTDGSANFGGANTGVGSSSGVETSHDGLLKIQRADGAGGISFAVYGGVSRKASISSDGSAVFAGQVTSRDLVVQQTDDTFPVYRGLAVDGTNTSRIDGDGSAEFAAGDIQLLANGSAYCSNRIMAGTRASGSEGGFSQAYGITAYSRHDASSTAAAVFGQNFTAGGRVWSGVNAAAAVTSEIFEDGSAEFAGGATQISSNGIVKVSRTAGTNDCFEAQLNGVANAYIKADGSATFAGDVTVGNYQSGTAGTNGFEFRSSGELVQNRNGADAYTLYNNSAAKTVTITAAGAANFAGTVTSTALANYGFLMANPSNTNQTSGGLFQTNIGQSFLYLKNGFDTASTITLDGADGSAAFAGTVTANGSVLTRAAGDLDVGDRLEKADAALQTLKTAAAASTDFASLKSAIATALANI